MFKPNASNVINHKINVVICPTTGGQFHIEINAHDTVDDLRKKIARQLQTPHERLKILFKERVLTNGKIEEHEIVDGSKIRLIPAVESGFSSTVQGTQQSVIQAIESLSDIQIDDFLSGRSPLTLALRVGDHMMFVQLQLEQSIEQTLASMQSTSKNPSAASFHQSSSNSHPQYSSHSSLPHQSPRASNSTSRMFSPTNVTSRTMPHMIATTSTSPSISSNNTPHSTSASANSTSKCQVSSSNSSHKFKDKRTSTTCGKITSGVGSMTHHGSSVAGPRFSRQMHRLRRLCSAHQQCVVYSSRELASEISSIVHAAKNHSVSENGSSGSTHRQRSGKNSSKERCRGQCSSLHYNAGNWFDKTTVPGASIDSITSHGSGIFSGTFSGSLHPNIQDEEGRPKRNPQTIVQILTDLLSATNQYEGNTGSIGMLPQLFKDHLNKQRSNKTTSSTDHPDQESRYRRAHRTSHPHNHHPYSTKHQLVRKCCNVDFSCSSTDQPRIPPSSFGSSAMTGCKEANLNYINSAYDGMLSSQKNVINDYQPNEKCSRGNHIFGQSNPSDFSGELSSSRYCSASFRSRKSKKPSTNLNVYRGMTMNSETYTTLQKVQILQRKMEIRRSHRQMRRLAYIPYNQRSGFASVDGVSQVKRKESNPTLNAASVEGTSLCVQDNKLSDFAGERTTEVVLETPETVTV